MLHDNELSVATWNVQGMGEADKVKALQNWLRGAGKKVRILALQELKAGEHNLEFQIRQVIPQAFTIIDYTQIDKGGTALIIHPSLKVRRSGVRGDGTVAWIEVETELGVIGVASVYGPREPDPKAELLEWLKMFNEGGKWLLMGDWNFVTEPIDSVGPSQLLHGGLLRKWRSLDQEWDLVDLRHCAGDKQGPFYTRQAKQGDRLDQARLDRVYANKQGLWLDAVVRVKHDGREVISDHIPVIVDTYLSARTQGKKKKRTLQTKMDVESLQDPIFREQVKSPWQEGWNMSDIPTVVWTLAWGKVQALYKERRNEMQRNKSKLEALKDSLDQYSKGNQLRKRSRGVPETGAGGEATGEIEQPSSKAQKPGDVDTRGGEEDDIMEEIFEFYRKLYAKEDLPPGHDEEEAIALQTLDKHVSEEENSHLEEHPVS
ncbi:hypothetical protein R1sor_022240 [Riccia sorocarpa]|uniref:Endonuclease/exonuclease/phosphatase domain-containing protein n=1 Tax=Riccia sorocarpa TaxID=122646 RepID=A0ABD3GNJ3_9MARC